MASAASTAWSAWSGSASGAPNSAITMSPTNLSTVPRCVEQHGDHPREVLVQLGDDVLGLPALGERREAADVGEEHRHLAPLAAEPGPRRVRHQLVVDVLRDEPREDLLHLALLAAFHEVLVGRRAEGRRTPRPAPARRRASRRRGRRRTTDAPPSAASHGQRDPDGRPHGQEHAGQPDGERAREQDGQAPRRRRAAAATAATAGCRSRWRGSARRASCPARTA